MLFVIGFQLSSGPIPFTHAQETCLAFTLGLTNLTIFVSVMIFSFIGPVLMDKIGTIGVFIFFGITSAISLLYAMCVTRNTSYKYVEVDEVNDVTKV